MAQGNLLLWANSIRSNMANDFGREFFQQQVQTQGFLFLDDYLGNILSGTKQEPLIELVKTPGRRKAVTKKPKLASKLGNPIIFSLGSTVIENGPRDYMVNQAPGAREPDQQKALHLPDCLDRERQENQALSGAEEGPPRIQSDPPEDGEMNVVPDDSHLRPAPVEQEHEQGNLSVIAEDDEPTERSRTSIRPSVPSPKEALPATLPSPPKPNVVALPSIAPTTINTPGCGNDSDIATGEDLSFHSIPINSPSEYHSAQATPHSPVFLVNRQAPSEPQTVEELKDDKEELIANSNQQSHRIDTGYTSMFLQDTADTIDMQIPLRDADSSNKTTSMAIPSLPEPMPLRKSMRAASVGTALLGGATPGYAAGKRTSWLMKAREVKALDMTTKKSSASTFPPLHAAGGSSTKSSKRKSGEIESLASPSEDKERKSKVAKHEDGETPSSNALEVGSKAELSIPTPMPTTQTNVSTSASQASPGVLDRLKKTVEGLVGKTTTKPGSEGPVVSVIAEARAAAEARIAERNHQEEPSLATRPLSESHKMEVDSAASTRLPQMTLTELFPPEGRVKEKHKVPEKPFRFSPLHKNTKESTSSRDSTTPPHSPPAPSSSLVAPTALVFNKPPPVFVPPPSLPSTRPLPSPPAPKEFTFHPPPQSMFSATLGFSSPFGSQKARVPLTAQSTMESMHSERLFDEGDDVPAWMPNTQDTEYTTGFDTQIDQNMICDEDDSWPVDEKLAAGVQWTFGGGMSKEDSMTWSTLPSQSQRGGDTGPFGQDRTTSSLRNAAAVDEHHGQHSGKIPGAFESATDHDQQDENVEGVKGEDKELEEIILGDVKSFVPTETKSFRPQSQMSMVSTSSSQSQSQGGFLNQASKLFSNALGTTKKKQPEVKNVLSKAAAAAKKQQEEADKKAVRLKEMEIRRHQANQRKTEEEKTKQMEEERKKKDEAERRRREREEQAHKRPIKPTPVKKDEEIKKRPEAEKKPELKKTTSVSNMKAQLKPAIKSSTIVSKTATYGGSSQPALGPSSKPTEMSKLPKFTPSSSLKGKAKVQAMSEEELGQPSQLLHDQMAARAKAQIKASKQAEALVPSESIELPDINSEYSDSDDEDRPRTYDPPNWAQSPELREQLKLQSTINPDDIFGAVRPLRMEEIFRTRTSRFRARTSSANWTGTDRLTVAEEKDYATRMGFQ